MKVGFEKWWDEEGRFLDPDTSDVPWYDKREGLAALAFEAGIKCGMARAGNYTADDETMPESVTFANGRIVRIVENKQPGVHHGVYLEVETVPTKCIKTNRNAGYAACVKTAGHLGNHEDSTGCWWR